MASLESKILGDDKKDNYCSSSEGEEDQFHDAQETQTSSRDRREPGRYNVRAIVFLHVIFLLTPHSILDGT